MFLPCCDVQVHWPVNFKMILLSLPSAFLEESWDYRRAPPVRLLMPVTGLKLSGQVAGTQSTSQPLPVSSTKSSLAYSNRHQYSDRVNLMQRKMDLSRVNSKAQPITLWHPHGPCVLLAEDVSCCRVTVLRDFPRESHRNVCPPQIGH